MYRHISKGSQLLVISDTGMLMHNGRKYAFGPVVREFEYLLDIFDKIIWIGYLDENPDTLNIFDEISSARIEIVPLKKIGGKRFIDKLKVILRYPYMFFSIYKYIRRSKYIHTRSPSHPAFVSMIFSFFFKRKRFWHKYAGSWIDDAPWFYRAQRNLLKKLGNNSKVTINGNWESKDTILSFENPCLTAKDRILGNTFLKEKDIKHKINFCFVGALNGQKGVDKILDAFSSFYDERIGEINVVGDGVKKEDYATKARSLKNKFNFYGFLNKSELIKVYEKSHFLLLPSKSEGFPKVIGEAMNFCCIPISSNVSCIDQYIEHRKNGFLIEPNTAERLKSIAEVSTSMTNDVFLGIIKDNYKDSNVFTYDNYVKRIQTEIFELDQ
ncbi:glycosyltransferase [Flavobacteriaceae bacterium S356]|uniref:Glycosyltransferase n=1 Tax=Asprobacillus argus TaxID=3076534 RepID=A0ABU3LFG3_9FLAO|nr:glycosyltransferase [Flavobacteriaceae bacterium S356]